MQTSMKTKSLIFILAILSSGLSQGMTWEEWAESRHPPSDKGPLPDGCSPVKYRGGFHPIVEYVRGRGNHCVVHDFVQRKLRDFINGRVRGSPTDEAGQGSVISFSEDSHSNIDLRKHLISGKPFENTRGIGMNSKSLTHLAVHNGKIETPGPLGIGIDMAPYIEGRQRLQELTEDRPAIKEVGYSRTFAGIWDYTPPTFYTAENLQIKSGGRAIIMAGSDNVVRNNTIEVDGRTAVYLYGPRSLVEGNTFIVHMDLRDKAPLPAILKLRDADGSIIRNNRFIVKRSGLFRKKEEEPQAGINLLESKDVVIEGNVFEEITLPVRKDAASTTTESGNISKGSP
ncbi:right-handed parallel beta-helix repeat-containing protein [Delftia lacustris]|jgi:Right handed beta helix region|uniref:right-handed parallel beta-helix repeat-containing protein n=1 Tax=Delftia TaxID=80865 RepID=UPI001FCC24A6|nr:right-handed parallel beta-helix repeat-containing protein [Delftia lacustris]